MARSLSDARWSEMTVEAIEYRRQRDYLSGGDMAWRYMQAWRDVDFLLRAAQEAPAPEGLRLSPCGHCGHTHFIGDREANGGACGACPCETWRPRRAAAREAPAPDGLALSPVERLRAAHREPARDQQPRVCPADGQGWPCDAALTLVVLSAALGGLRETPAPDGLRAAAEAAAVVTNIRALHKPNAHWQVGRTALDGPCVADGSAWPCDAEYAARLLAAQEAPAPDGLRLARAIHEGRITVKAHGDFTDRCICNEIARDILRGMAGLVPKPNIENVIADYRAEARPPEGLDTALAALENDAAAADHDSIEDGPAFARGIRYAAARLSAGGATKPCPDHDPNGGPGSDQCPNCGRSAGGATKP